MTAAEFGKFGRWREGMKVVYRQHDQYWVGLLLEVNFDQRTVTLDDDGDFITLGHAEILGVLNPKGTVAYPREGLTYDICGR